jgi:hypothetical protein
VEDLLCASVLLQEVWSPWVLKGPGVDSVTPWHMPAVTSLCTTVLWGDYDLHFCQWVTRVPSSKYVWDVPWMGSSPGVNVHRLSSVRLL